MNINLKKLNKMGPKKTVRETMSIKSFEDEFDCEFLDLRELGWMYFEYFDEGDWMIREFKQERNPIFYFFANILDFKGPFFHLEELFIYKDTAFLLADLIRRRKQHKEFWCFSQPAHDIQCVWFNGDKFCQKRIHLTDYCSFEALRDSIKDNNGRFKQIPTYKEMEEAWNVEQ